MEAGKPVVYTIVERAPTAAEYESLCRAVGWQHNVHFPSAAKALSGSLHHVVAEHGGTPVGMGRIVGDGAIFFYVHDVVVIPEHQGKGVGQLITQRLVDWLKAHAPPRAYAFLFAATGKDGFYRSFGFQPSEKGMMLALDAIRRA